MTQQLNSNSIKDAYQAGFNAFHTVVQNERGFWINPPNPHKAGGQFNREWERGYNDAYFANVKRAV